MSHPDADKWNAVYLAGKHDRNQPARVLKDYAHLLPEVGKALDLACGTGANAIFLAQHGLQTSAWDISEQAIKRLNETANLLHLNIYTDVRDVIAKPPEADMFDVIVVSYFLDRGLMPLLIKALRNGGLLFYQTFIKEKVDDSGPHNPDYRLDANELLRLFAGSHIIYYREEGSVGRTGMGLRNEAVLVAQKR